MRRITHDLYVQLGDLKGQIAIADDSASTRLDERIRNESQACARAHVDALGQDIGKMVTELRTDLESVVSQQNQRLADMGRVLEEQNRLLQDQTRQIQDQNRQLQDQNRQISEQDRQIENQNRLLEEQFRRVEAQDQRLAAAQQSMRETASAEAHAIAERVVVNAAKRISDQMAESFLHVLRPYQDQQSKSA